MIDRIAGNKLLPANFRQDIVERTDGIPLFVEEMTKAVLEAEGEGEARRTIATVPSPALAVPPSLHASLMARLDRLDPAKAGCGESRNVFRARTNGRACATGEVLGTARCHQPRTPLARSGQARPRPRSSRSSLRLVHRRLRHARREGSQNSARRAGFMRVLVAGTELASQPPCTPGRRTSVIPPKEAFNCRAPGA